MDIKNHYLMTFGALFFLGLIVANPGETFTHASTESRECKLVKGKLDCPVKNREYQINHSAVHYEYR